jgi:hypothetical protein
MNKRRKHTVIFLQIESKIVHTLSNVDLHRVGCQEKDRARQCL